MAKFQPTKGVPKLPPAFPSMMAPGGGVPATAQADISQSQPKAPGGGGFLINPNSFSDKHAGPPAARGAKKSAGYPNFTKNP